MSTKVQIIIAIIGLIGTLGAAFILKFDFSTEKSVNKVLVDENSTVAVGLWKIQVAYNDQYKHSDANYWRLYEDGRIGLIGHPNSLGVWFFEGSSFQLTYDNGLIWTGKLKENIISGQVKHDDGEIYNFSALKLSSDPTQKVKSYATCFLQKDPSYLSCIDREKSPCSTTTGLSFSILSQCIEHCEDEANRRGLKCIIK